jgi:hypothetical protein
MAGSTSVTVVQKLIPALVLTSNLRLATVLTSDIADLSQIRRIIVKAKSTLDQQVSLQLIGDMFSPMDVPTLISGSYLVPVGSVTVSSLSIGFADDDWQPYVAVQLTTLVAPTVGQIQVWIAGQV